MFYWLATYVKWFTQNFLLTAFTVFEWLIVTSIVAVNGLSVTRIGRAVQLYTYFPNLCEMSVWWVRQNRRDRRHRLSRERARARERSSGLRPRRAGWRQRRGGAARGGGAAAVCTRAPTFRAIVASPCSQPLWCNIQLYCVLAML